MGYFLGLDLGKVRDYTALAVLETVPAPPLEIVDEWSGYVQHVPSKAPPALHLRHLERFTRGTAYPRIVQQVGQRMQALKPPVRAAVPAGPILVVDHTGVGVAVVDLFEEAGLQPVAITITGGDTVTWDGLHVRVPKRELVTCTHVAMQTGRLKFAESLPDLPTLLEELGNFSYTISAAGHDSYGAAADWRTGNHDDLVLAVSMAVWYAEKGYTPPWTEREIRTAFETGRTL